jgi:hypothetical protein
VAITQPNFLHVFDEASGSTVQNFGSTSGSYTAQHGVETTNWARHSTGGPYGHGYFESKTDAGSGMTYLSTAATTPGPGLHQMNFCVGFRVTSFSNGACYLLAPTNDTTDGGCRIALSNLSGGTFSLDAYFNAGNSASMTQVTGLATGVDHIIACSVDVTTATAVQARFKVNALAATAPATVNMNTFSFEDAHPQIMRRADFNNYYGLVGRVNIFVGQRGTVGSVTPWDATDLGTITGNPASAFATWLGGGGSIAPLAQATYRRRRSIV